MTSIIAYGTVVRSPIVLGLPLPDEERSVGFSIVVEEDFGDEECRGRRGLYRVILSGPQASYAEANLRVGTAVLIRGELFSQALPVGDPSWNHRVVFGAEIVILSGELSSGRVYHIDEDLPVERLLSVG